MLAAPTAEISQLNLQMERCRQAYADKARFLTLCAAPARFKNRRSSMLALRSLLANAVAGLNRSGWRFPLCYSLGWTDKRSDVPVTHVHLDQSIEHFHAHGWLRVSSVFDVDSAERMRNVVWAALAGSGVYCDRPSTWTIERPAWLQHIRNHSAFSAIGSACLRAVIDALLESQRYNEPRNWGACFVAFPSNAPWGVPNTGWHIDANYRSVLQPPGGLKTLALFGDVAHRGGATLVVSGSHRLVHGWFRENPASSDARSIAMRKLLLRQSYIRDLHREGDRAERIARFMDRVEVADGTQVQVVELTGTVGDVLILHPLVLHAAPRTIPRSRASS
jgi:ectoine hydroxylase-related dioxygenase (phytanoyl-CoA dioxygenase family)